MRRPPTGLSLAHSIRGGFWAAVPQITKRQHIEIRPHQWGWSVFERRPEACVSEKDHAIDYAQNRAYFRSGEIRILDSAGYVERTIPFNEADDEQLTSGFAVSVFADSYFVPSHVPTAAILLPQKQGKTRFFAFYVLE